MQESARSATTPVNVYRTADRLTVASPMPGLVGSEDITVEITEDRHLILNGEPRGIPKGVPEYHIGAPSLVEQKDLVQAEWTVGPYRREIPLPTAVDGPQSTVTYGNGILVVAMPIARDHRSARIRLESMGPFRAEYVGSAGHPVSPLTTAEHQGAMLDMQMEHRGREHPAR